MINVKYWAVTILMSAMLCIVAGIFHQNYAQQPGQHPQHDPLMPLKMALTEAAAPALTTQQEDQIKQALSDFHNSQGAPMPNQNLIAAHRAYDDAVLAGDSATALAQANIINSLRNSEGSARLQAETTVKI